MSELARGRPRLEVIEGEGLTTQRRIESVGWMALGHCRAPGIRPTDMAPAISNEVGIAIAKRICQDCIIKRPCLESALARREEVDFGIWGGTTPEERHVIRVLRPKST